MQIPILTGIYTDSTPDARQSYPVNMIPVPKDTGVSAGYLRPADGIVENGAGPGDSRGGIEWNGELYRVMGSKFARVGPDGAVTVIGDVGAGGQVTMDFSFDRLAIASNGKLWYYQNNVLTQVTDPNLGTVIDFCWISGYFAATDGDKIRLSDLNDPMVWPVLAYGSAELSPDPVVALLRFRNEIYAVNRNTIEVFTQIVVDPGAQPLPYPFRRVDGAQTQKGAIGTHAVCVFNEVIAFVGSGPNESPAVYLTINGNLDRISTQDIDLLLMRYTEEELSKTKLETRNDKAHQLLYIHLPDRTLVYDQNASKKTNVHVWWQLTSSLAGFSQYRGIDLVWCYDRWNVADPTTAKLGYLDRSVSSHYGDHVRWEFSTQMIYNEGRGAQIHRLELTTLAGAVNEVALAPVETSYSLDGQTWSQPFAITVGQTGARTKRFAWFRQGFWRNIRIQRFRSTTQTRIAPMRLEADVESMGW